MAHCPTRTSLLLLLHLLTQAAAYPCDPTDVAFSVVVNNWRVAHGLRAQPISASLVHTSRAHGSAQHDGAFNPATGCNAHSWTADPTGAERWVPCCYNPSNLGSTQSCMTKKPKEVTGGGYTGNGYEIAATNRGNNADGYQRAVEAWDNSGGHRPYLMNGGGNVENAMGCSMNGLAVCFFSAQSEGSREGNYGLCDGTSKRNSRCMGLAEGQGCEEAGPCEWCGGGAWKCCREGYEENGCDGVEGRPNSHICVGGEDPPGTIAGNCAGPNCFDGTPSTTAPAPAPAPSINDDESGGASPSAAAGNNNKATNGGNTKTNTVSAGGGKGEGTDGETSDDVDDEEGGVARTIGGVVGGIAAVVLVGGCLVYAVHSRRKSAARALDKPAIPTEKQQKKRGSAPDLPPRPGNLEKRVEMFKFTNEHFERSPPPTPAED